MKKHVLTLILALAPLQAGTVLELSFTPPGGAGYSWLRAEITQEFWVTVTGGPAFGYLIPGLYAAGTSNESIGFSYAHLDFGAEGYAAFGPVGIDTGTVARSTRGLECSAMTCQTNPWIGNDLIPFASGVPQQFTLLLGVEAYYWSALPGFLWPGDPIVAEASFDGIGTVIDGVTGEEVTGALVDIEPVSTPEPLPAAMIGAGLILLGLAGKMRRR